MLSTYAQNFVKCQFSEKYYKYIVYVIMSCLICYIKVTLDNYSYKFDIST